MRNNNRENLIIEKSKEKGWEVLSFEDGFALLTCVNGHKFKLRAGDRHYPRRPCAYCSGNRTTLDDFEHCMQEIGYKVIDVTSHKDVHDNVIVKTGDSATFICDKGHTQTRLVRQCIHEETPCTVCKGTVQYNGYSRSEAIISDVLTYYGIEHIREYEVTHNGENLKVDFYIPSLNTIIEYDGKQHTMGRPMQVGMSMEERTRRDDARDDFAVSNGIHMIRIDDKEKGNRLIQYLAIILPEVNIEPLSEPMIAITRHVYNTSADMFGWTSYDELEHISDTHKKYGLTEAVKILNKPRSVIARSLHVVRGVDFY